MMRRFLLYPALGYAAYRFLRRSGETAENPVETAEPRRSRTKTR